MEAKAFSQGLQRLGRVGQVFQVTMKHARLLHQLQHLPGFLRIPAQGLGAQHRLAGRGGQAHCFQVQVVRQADHHHISVGRLNSFGHVRFPVRDIPFGGELLRPLFRPGIDGVHPVGLPLPVQAHGVKSANQTGTQKRDAV
jgi:hypothetical protein